MDIQSLIQKVDSSISELTVLREQLIQLLNKAESCPENTPLMRNIFTGTSTYNGLDVRVANILKANDLYDIPVETFVIKCSPKRFSTFRWSGKVSVDYIRKTLKEELSIDW
jgi:hypothetical protein